MHLPDVLHNGELGITEVLNYRAFYPTSTELKIDAELIPKLRLNMDERIGKAPNSNIEYSFKTLEHSKFEYSNYSLATLAATVGAFLTGTGSSSIRSTNNSDDDG